MAERKVTQSQLMANLVLIYDSLQEILTKFALASNTSYAQNVTAQWYGNDGQVESMNIPSLGYIKTDIKNLHDTIETLINDNDDKLSLEYADGSVRSFEMRKISELLDILNSTKDVSFENPSEFKAKTNWMFESYLNPLLYMPVNISQFLNKDNDIKKFSVRRVILNSPSSDDITFFDASFNNINTLDYDTTVRLLNEQGIVYNVDDTEYELSACVNSKRGSFSVIAMDTVSETVDGVEELVDYYTLDKLSYANTVKNSGGSSLLEYGDILITSDNTEYRVEGINKAKRAVKLRRIFGSMPITLGADILKIKPEAYRIPELQVNVGYNEYEIVFVKPISAQMDMTTDEWSKGFGVYTCNLNTTLNDGTVVSLKDYYENYVSDFGLVMLNMAKEKQVPSAIGVKPDAPVLDEANLKVVCINSHLANSNETSNFANLIATKNNLKSQISEIEKKINNAKEDIGRNNATTKETAATQTEINNLTNKKSGLQHQLNTTLNQITTMINSENNILVSPKYRIRGFVDIPTAKQTEYGKQEIIQMCVSYRYKSPSNNATTNNALNHIDSNGETVSAYFSPWTDVYSHVRKKVYDKSKGIYVWDTEDISNADVININQVDIPITRGELVEIRVKSVSEAGYPINPLESDWSNTITMSFPEEFETTNESAFLAEQLLIENALSNFNEELISMMLDKHLEDSFWTNEKYYAHNLNNIASGFYTDDYKNISAYDYLKILNDKISLLESQVKEEVANLKISIVCEDGTIIKVSPGNVIELPVEYYKNSIETDGDIIEKIYTLKLENTSASILELVSYFSSPLSDIQAEAPYDKGSISIEGNSDTSWASLQAQQSFQSGQARSQFIYCRNTNYGGSKTLYTDSVDSISDQYSTNCTDRLKTFPYSGKSPDTQPSYILCFPVGADKGSDYGLKSNFFVKTNNNNAIIHTFKNTKTGWADSMQTDGGTASKDYMLFSHSYAMHICKEEGSEVIEGTQTTIQYYQQQSFVPGTASTESDKKTANYPIKCGFEEQDKYFGGKYTCGAYLFLRPSSYSAISVSGNVASSVRKLEHGVSIQIPIVFQFRCTDVLGVVGGYGNTERENITYQKIIGLDVVARNSSIKDIISFDVIATCKYKN